MTAKAVARRKWPWIVGGVMLLVAAAVAALAPLQDWSEAMEQSLEGMSLGMGLLAFCAISVLGTMLMIPAWIFPIAAGRGALTGGPLKWAMLAAGVAATVAMALIVGRAVRKRLQID